MIIFGGDSPATIPSGRDNKVGWYDTHERHMKLASYSQPSVILIGDAVFFSVNSRSTH